MFNICFFCFFLIEITSIKKKFRSCLILLNALIKIFFMPFFKEKLKHILILILIFNAFTYAYSYPKHPSKSLSTKENIHSIAAQKCPYHNYGLLSVFKSEIEQDFNAVIFKVVNNLPGKINCQHIHSDFQSEIIISPIILIYKTTDSLSGFIIQKLLSING